MPEASKMPLRAFWKLLAGSGPKGHGKYFWIRRMKSEAAESIMAS